MWVAVCYGDDDAARGYVVYTLRSGRVNHRARDQELVIRDLAWLDAEAYRSLWRFIASHDLVGRVRWSNAPADDPAAEFFLEPRLLNAEDHEGAWFRVVDAAGALAERGYDVEGRTDHRPQRRSADAMERRAVVPRGRNRRCPHASRRRRHPTSSCRARRWHRSTPASAPPRKLANWGLLAGDRRALAKADGLFRTRYAPHTPDHF